MPANYQSAVSQTGGVHEAGDRRGNERLRERGGQPVTDLCATDAVTLAGMLRRREVSAREAIAAHIQRIVAGDGGGNPIVTRTFDAALGRAAPAGGARAPGAGPGPPPGPPAPPQG